MNDFLGLGKLSQNGLEVIKLVYPDLAQPALRKVGQALETTLDFTMIPVKYLGMFSQKADIQLKRNLNKYQEKLETLDMDSIGSVPPEIGVPILEELTRITNEELTEMYTNLLVNASTVEKSRHAHPSFINVLKNISSDEARIIDYIMHNEKKLPIYVRYERESSAYGPVPVTDNINNINTLVSLDFPDNNDFYIKNLVSLGIVEAKDLYYRFQVEQYKVFEESINRLKEQANETMNKMIELEQANGEFASSYKLRKLWGHFKVTDYGKEFFKGITLENN
ncbi:DUF4393 domain-containing protein [Niallia sp. NCCP-28]|uniref:DUF4393 domain-containing protein n=1 Tax=Niallia sp. NCCP-28 TaxID=2934712 RepID=UPI0020835E04|nr:DUF4393 domain-containing protein [Niallia sp. NCCP-28]GKU82575.1 hypothetical protein NCCP28_19710 [Niallia sp. NCCP-28]